MLYKFMSGSNQIKNILKIVSIILFCFATLILFFCTTALIVSKINFSYDILSSAITVILGITSFFNGFILSKLFKENGLFWGIFAGIATIIILIVFALIFDTLSFSTTFFTKIIVILCSGAIGGIIGVNIN